MKKIIPFFFLTFLISCAIHSVRIKSSNVRDSTKVYPLHAVLWDNPDYTPAMDSAMSLLDRSTAIIEKAIDNKIPLKLSQKKSGELMDSFFALYHKIPSEDTSIIYQYRIKLINQLIDYKLKHK